MWPAEWDELEAALAHVTPWKQEHIHRALTLAWAEGRPVAWTRTVLLASAEAVDSFERSMAKIRQALDMSPGEVLSMARQVEALANP